MWSIYAWCKVIFVIVLTRRFDFISSLPPQQRSATNELEALKSQGLVGAERFTNTLDELYAKQRRFERERDEATHATEMFSLLSFAIIDTRRMQERLAREENRFEKERKQTDEQMHQLQSTLKREKSSVLETRVCVDDARTETHVMKGGALEAFSKDVPAAGGITAGSRSGGKRSATVYVRYEFHQTKASRRGRLCLRVHFLTTLTPKLSLTPHFQIGTYEQRLRKLHQSNDSSSNELKTLLGEQQSLSQRWF